MHVNKVHHVTTIAAVAEEFAVDEDWIYDLAIQMDVEDGCVWVHDTTQDGTLAFTDEGIEALREIARTRHDCPLWLKYQE